jgi:hypothetical protein
MATKVPGLINYPTRYEVTLTDGSRSYVITFTARKSRPGLLTAMRAHGPAILRVTQLSHEARCHWLSTSALDLGENGWVVKFTGRTQRDAICTDSLLPSVEAASGSLEDGHAR